MEDKEYFIVEYRFPILVNKAKDPKEACHKAAKICEQEFGFYPSNWFARVFKYLSNSEVIGPESEYFFGPSGTDFRKIDVNLNIHNDLRMQKDESDSSN